MASHARIDFVALDLGNVLCDLEPASFARALAQATGTTVEAVRAAFPSREHEQMECGQVEPGVFRQALLNNLGASLSDAEFDRCWNLLPVPRAGADALVERLRVPHVIWSNTDPIHVHHLTQHLAAIRQARHAHMSCFARARKPDRAYFEAGLRALDAPPEHVLFVDDRAENIEGASALGIVARSVVTLAELENVLTSFGVFR